MDRRDEPPVPFSIVFSSLILLLLLIVGCDYIEYKQDREQQNANFTYIEWKKHVLNEGR